MPSRKDQVQSRKHQPAPAPLAGSEYYVLGVGAIAVLLGLGIAWRGALGHDVLGYVASGAVFVLFGLWRLKQWADARRRSRR